MTTDPITVLYGISQLTIGGAERQLYELARHIDQTRYRPLVFTTSEGGVYADLLREAGIPLYVFPRSFAYDMRPVWRIAQLMRRERVQILHTFGYYGGLYGRLATLFYRPYIVISSERATKAWMKHLHNPVYFAVDQLLARRTDCFIANAEAVKQFAVEEKKMPADKVHVIYNGVDIDRFTAVAPQLLQRLRTQFGLDDNTRAIGIVARLDPMKDHYTFLRAAAIVSKTAPSVKFFIIGDGHLRDTLTELSTQLQLDQQLVFTGEKKRAELVNLMALMDIVALSSKEGEGCSNAILEAMVLGKPIVATNVGGNSELVVDAKTGFIVPPESPETLATAIIHLLKDDQLREKMGYAAQKRVEDMFSVARMVNETEALYQRLNEHRVAYPV